MVSIAEERRRLAEVGFVFDDMREDWGAEPPPGKSYTDPRAVVIPALGFFQHVAVVADPSDLVGSERQVMRTIERIGWARFENTGYSYNAASFNSGRMMEGQPFGRRGAHTYNDFNRAVCSTPGCPSKGQPLKFDGAGSDRRNLNYTHRAVVFPQRETDPVTDAQVHGSAQWAAALILAALAEPGARWHGHRCVAAKDCPGDPAWARMGDIEDLTADYVRTGLPGTQPEPTPKGNPDMILVKQANTDRVWLIDATTKRHVETVAALNVLRGVGVPFDSEPPFSSQLLQAWTSGPPITDQAEPAPEPPPAE